MVRTMIDLDEAERVGKEATEGPWVTRDEMVLHRPDGRPSVPLFVTDCADDEDSRFVVYARNHWQEMIDELRELRKMTCPTLEKYGRTCG